MEIGLGINNFLPSLNSLGINNNSNTNESISYSPLINQDFTLFSSALVKKELIKPFDLFKENNMNQKPNIDKNPPSFSDIRKGAVLKKGDKSDSVKELQIKLTSLGFKVDSTGYFGDITEMKLKQFQKKYGISQTGKLGQTTIKKLDELTNIETINSINISSIKVGLGKPTPMGAKIAVSAKREASRRNTVGWCYAGVATAISRVCGDFLYGKSAYMAANILATNSKFKEVKVKPSDLKKLAPGSIVVWGKTKVSPHGHISVAIGNGKEASDHVASQMTSLRGHQNFRVFTPKV
jgi:peptidoglycan hydrolase-like protein with peptidoglycan-binding domain